jgi:hypothetical protein
MINRILFTRKEKETELCLYADNLDTIIPWLINAGLNYFTIKSLAGKIEFLISTDDVEALLKDLNTAKFILNSALPKCIQGFSKSRLQENTVSVSTVSNIVNNIPNSIMMALMQTTLTASASELLRPAASELVRHSGPMMMQETLRHTLLAPPNLTPLESSADEAVNTQKMKR